MIRFSTAVLATLAVPALGAPVLITFPTENPPNTRFRTYNPSAPDFELDFDLRNPEGGQFGTDYYPMIVDAGTGCYLISGGLHPEAARIGYRDNDGLLIESAITSNWVTTPAVCEEFDPGVLPVAWEFDPAPFECPGDCPSYSSPYRDEGVLYIPFRWDTDDAPGDYYFGWVSFEVTTLPELGTCPGDGGNPLNACSDEPDTYTRQRFRWVAVGYETEPNTPIIAGAGFCPGDINTDGVLDIFDIFDYLDLFNTMDPAADYTNDGSIDVFDVFAFLNDFQSPCEF